VEGTCFKLWYTGTATNKNGVGVLIDKSLKDGVVDVKRLGDRIILIKLVIGHLVLNVISAYAPQVGLNENSKREFWEGLKDMISSVPVGEKLFIGGVSMAMWVHLEPVLRVCMEASALGLGIKKERKS
jgi:hypothetical protein